MARYLEREKEMTSPSEDIKRRSVFVWGEASKSTRLIKSYFSKLSTNYDGRGGGHVMMRVLMVRIAAGLFLTVILMI